ncbi:GNAT family N-acetyltransferase [Runella slithyformis]|uniref:Acetyltransferase n=1 Tax=Runella slithyformis (strain ATCC 29530 / DSM 19594 / LMG 11500 / NCIMB 11436 / LSU 4) TaxID=761193 RepID=A0A7U3ZP39_RUNSL|nr:GNAT family N-acetyltransferase [Runella slithyformis]AEI50770.1 putative acetyltransferase [Runella slithyformis DSM 19594]
MNIINNVDLHRFEAEVDGETAFVEYQWKNETIYILHTFVPHALRGRGLAGQLAEFVLTRIREEQWPVKIYCPFFAKYIEEHPEYRDLIHA